MATIDINPQVQNTVTDSPTARIGRTISKKLLEPATWKPWERFLFRVAFVFFIIMSIPNSPAWYKAVFRIDWTSLNYRDLYDIARFSSGITWFGNSIFGSSLLGYATWIITLVFSAAIALVWSAIVRTRGIEKREYNNLYYWLRAIVRYRAGIGIIGFGFTKLLPVQMPDPSLGVLNTNFGDLTAQKIYWLSIGIVPWYQVFAGVVEVLAGSLLFFRRTTTIGGILLFGALGDIVFVNFAYDGGVHLYSSYFVLLAAFLLVEDTPDIYNLFIRRRFTVPVHNIPAFPNWLKYTRITLKTGVIAIFLVLLFWLQLVNFKYDPYKQPSVAGVKTLRGNYAVSEFKINNQSIPYSPLDTIRWQEATFENWTTLTFRVNKPHLLDLSNGGGAPQRDINRNFELAGVGGGQQVFHYYADEVNKTLYLQDKFRQNWNRLDADGNELANNRNNVNQQSKKSANRKSTEAGSANEQSWIPQSALTNIGDEVYKIDKRAISTRRIREFQNAPKNEKRNRMVLKYETEDGSRVILSGINENRDSIYVVLDRINRHYVLQPSSLQAGKY